MNLNYAQRSFFTMFPRATLSTFVAVSIAVSGVVANGEIIYGVSGQQGLLVSFDSATPFTLTSAVNITGLQPNEQIRGLLPIAGALYALGQSSRIYIIDPITGSATAQNTNQFSPLLNGVYFGFCVGPTQIFLCSDLGQNLSIVPGSDTAVAGPTYSVSISAMAYDSVNSNHYGISAVTHSLYKLNPLTGGTTLIGPIGVNLQPGMGFDIDGSGTGYLSGTVIGGDQAEFYTVNLSTGALTFVGSVGAPGTFTSALTGITQGLKAAVAAPMLIDASMVNVGGTPSFQFAFSNNNPGATFTVLSATNLSGHLAGWSAIGTASNVAPGLFQFRDTNSTNARRFYGVRSP